MLNSLARYNSIMFRTWGLPNFSRPALTWCFTIYINKILFYFKRYNICIKPKSTKICASYNNSNNNTRHVPRQSLTFLCLLSILLVKVKETKIPHIRKSIRFSLVKICNYSQLNLFITKQEFSWK